MYEQVESRQNPETGYGLYSICSVGLKKTLDRLDQLVTKPVGEAGGLVTVGTGGFTVVDRDGGLSRMYSHAHP